MIIKSFNKTTHPRFPDSRRRNIYNYIEKKLVAHFTWCGCDSLIQRLPPNQTADVADYIMEQIGQGIDRILQSLGGMAVVECGLYKISFP